MFTPARRNPRSCITAGRIPEMNDTVFKPGPPPLPISRFDVKRYGFSPIYGTFTINEIKTKVKSGDIETGSLARGVGRTKWIMVGRLLEHIEPGSAKELSKFYPRWKYFSFATGVIVAGGLLPALCLISEHHSPPNYWVGGLGSSIVFLNGIYNNTTEQMAAARPALTARNSTTAQAPTIGGNIRPEFPGVLGGGEE